MTILTKHASTFLAALALSAASYSLPVAAVGAQEADQAKETAAVEALVGRFTAAQARHDAAVLRELTSARYVEISPLGDVDPREKMLGSYTGGPNATPPAVTVEEPSVTLLGDTAVMRARLHFTVSKGGQSRNFDMRTSYVAHKEDGRWKLVSLQATPIRPKS